MSNTGGGLGDRPPPPSGGGGGGSGGSGGGMDDFLNRRGFGNDNNGEEESENLKAAREAMSDDNLPISYGLSSTNQQNPNNKQDDEEQQDDGEMKNDSKEQEEEDMTSSFMLTNNPSSSTTSSSSSSSTTTTSSSNPLKENPYLDVVSSLSPSELISKFTSTAHPRVQDAVRATILGLIGTLPKMAFDTTTVTTGARLASLMFQLQMTGYMFKNAEYRLSLTQSLGRQQQQQQDDGDGSEEDGMMMMGSKFLLQGSSTETNKNKNKNKKEEKESKRDILDDDEDESLLSKGKVRGTLQINYGLPSETTDTADNTDTTTNNNNANNNNNSGIQVDAEAFTSELRSEVSRLREELQQVRTTNEETIKRDLLLYIRTLPPKQLAQLTETMSEDVLNAMKGLVNAVVRGIGGSSGEGSGEGGSDGGIGPETVTEQSGEAMAQLCMWQLVVGYNLRELEVREEMNKKLTTETETMNKNEKNDDNEFDDDDTNIFIQPGTLE